MTDKKNPISNPKGTCRLQSLIPKLFFAFAVLVSIVILEQNALLGFAAALVGGIGFGTLCVITREAKT